MRRLIYTFGLVFCFLTGSVFACNAPDKFVKGLVQDVMKDIERYSSEDALIKNLGKRLQKVSDVEYASAKILGSHYRGMSRADKKRFTSELSHYVVNGYVKALRQVDTRNRLKIYPVRGAVREVATVRTKYTARSGKPVKMNFILICSGGKWKVQDVSIEGVRVVDGYVSQLRPILERSGVKGVMKHISKK